MQFKHIWVAVQGRAHGFLAGAAGVAGAILTASPSLTPSGGLSIKRSEASKPDDNSTLLP
jgi:hypothetical protein